MADTCSVRWGNRVAKQLRKIPTRIARKFYSWVTAVHLLGIREVRRSPGFHDEPLQGHRLGQRSVRLSRSYRIIYEVSQNSKINVIEVLEITKHEY